MNGVVSVIVEEAARNLLIAEKTKKVIEPLTKVLSRNYSR